VTSAPRSIGILAHIDAGKTTVSEQLLFVSGAVRRPGSVDSGTTVSDWMLEEQERGITIASAASSFVWREEHVTLVDTPGHVDFTIEVERSLRVLDGVVLVISGPDRVQAQTETVWHQAARHALPAVGFVNKLDREGFELEPLLATIKERLGILPVLLQVPIVTDDRVVLIDVISGVRRVYDRADAELTYDAASQDDGLDETETLLRMEALEHLVDAIASYDDGYAEIVLDGREPSPDQHTQALARAVAARGVLPLVFGAARFGVGIDDLADAIVDLIPPAIVRSIPAFTPEGVALEALPPDLTSAYVFKTEPRRRDVRLAFVRVATGRIVAGDLLVRTPLGAPLGAARPVLVRGEEYEPIGALEPGAIGALLFHPGEPMPTTGETIGPTILPFTFERMRLPEPVIEVPIEAPDPSAHERMIAALQHLCADDPSLRLGTDRETGGAVLAGMGELHLEVARQRAGRALGLDLKAGRMQVRARRFLRDTARGEASVSHPTGRARVRIEVEASPRATPLTSTAPSAALVTSVPTLDRNEWRDAIISGLEGAAGLDGRGALQIMGAQLTVVLVDHHGTDVVPVMFRDAAEWAALRAIDAAHPVVAEPWCALVVIAPDIAIGRVVGDLARRGARVRKTESRGPIQELTCEAPLSQLIGYASDLRSMTAGRGQLSLEPIGYRPVDD